MASDHIGRSGAGAPAIDPTTLRAVAGTFASGITIITCSSGERLHGCVANAVMSVSLEPPLMLISLAESSRTRVAIEVAGAFAINILPDDNAGRELCSLFAGRGDDKFAAAHHRVGACGAPVLDGALGWFECDVDATYVAGDHTLFIGHVRAADHQQGEPLIFFRGRNRTLAA